MSHPARLVTAEEFARIPNDDYRYELVQGRVIRMSPPGSLHGALVIRLGSSLAQHVEAHDLGAVLAESGFKLASNPDTVRGPDLTFVRRERIPATGLPRGFWVGAPDLAVEISSPGDRRSEIVAKVDAYLALGVRVVWVIDFDARTVTIHRPGAAVVVLGEEDAVDGGDVLPGFRCDVRAIFAGL